MVIGMRDDLICGIFSGDAHIHKLRVFFALSVYSTFPQGPGGIYLDQPSL